MEQFPLLWRGTTVGEMTVETVGLYTCFRCTCRLPGDGLWHAWAVGEGGELRLGVLEPAGDRAVLRRRLSSRSWGHLGRLKCAQLRPAGEREEHWQPMPLLPFRTPWLRRELSSCGGILTRTEGGRRWIAVPYDSHRPFPLTQLFCLSSVRSIRGGEYVVFVFDENEVPGFSE